MTETDAAKLQAILVRAYGALEWAMGALEALETTREKSIGLGFLAEALDEVRLAITAKVD